MERLKRPYSLHSGPTKRRNRRIFYALFRDGNGVYRGSAVSTGCTRHDDAVRWCEARLKSDHKTREDINSQCASATWLSSKSSAACSLTRSRGKPRRLCLNPVGSTPSGEPRSPPGFAVGPPPPSYGCSRR